MSELTSKETKTMNATNPRRRSLLCSAAALAALAVWLLPAAPASAVTASAGWTLTGSPYPTNFEPEASGALLRGPGFQVTATNAGGAPTSGPFTIVDTLPEGLAVAEEEGVLGVYGKSYAEMACTTVGRTVTCEGAQLNAGEGAKLTIRVDVEPGAGPELINEATVSGGGAPEAVSTTMPVEISGATPPFDFLRGPSGAFTSLFGVDGSTATLAGSHPFRYDAAGMNFTFAPAPSGLLAVEGGVKDIVGELPRGMVINPTATPTRCTEAQLEYNTTFGGPDCPESSQIGTVRVSTSLIGPLIENIALYNMVPPPGVAAEFAFNPLTAGIYVHIEGRVRTGGDYGLVGATRGILSRPLNPVFGVDVTFWGDPTGNGVQDIRSECLNFTEHRPHCPLPEAEQTGEAAVTLPSDCPGTPATTTIKASSWLHPGEFQAREVESADANGNPVAVDGCNQLAFDPTIEAKPTTNLADSPSGLDFKLHQPQENQFEGRSTANLKDTEVLLPEGLVVNPSSADGLAACSPAQIGLKTAVGDSHAHFTETPPACPAASKLGSVEVKTPLLEEPLPGSIYIAQPYQNPFNSLLGLYLAVEYPLRGIQAKLPVKVEPDPVTGRLKATVTESPELPFEDVNLHFFGGARGTLRTPAACATYTTATDLTPWSTPEGANAHPGDSFAIQATPAAGACPARSDGAPNSPAFQAGTITPAAGAYSPFVLKLSRGDGTQPLAGIDTTLPKGLTGKLAGIPYCSEAEIAKAKSREAPNMGAEEISSPSCPAASEVGTLDTAAGAGPTPFHVAGHAYLAGPYKGAPLSLVTITPALAGPFDLGDVVVRVALNVNPETARIHAVSDPFPQVIDGIPLDIRSVALALGRSDFTINPTSCDPTTVSGTLTSAFGQSAPLSSPFQVGGCPALGFKPSLALRLSSGQRRAFPALRATYSARSGDANLADMVLTLPRTEFIEQAHFRTICTRVQFAAGAGNGAACPAGSVYGHVRATTPLLAGPLEGPVYLRSSTHTLPDVVLALNGQIDAAVPLHVDSIKGRLRASVEDAPDVPIAKVSVSMQGGKKGLFVNSESLCAKRPRASVKLGAQSGKALTLDPLLKAPCGGKGKGAGHKNKKHKG
jgi:hypothetical protein